MINVYTLPTLPKTVRHKNNKRVFPVEQPYNNQAQCFRQLVPIRIEDSQYPGDAFVPEQP